MSGCMAADAVRCRKGDIQLDWVIALFVFLIFLAWSFQFYATLFRAKSVPLDTVAIGVNDIIIGNITSRVYDYPVAYASPLTQPDGVMHAYHYWTSDGELNSTTVFDNSSNSVSCSITGNTIYWSADVVAGQNNFTIRVSNRTAASKNCTGTFSTANSNLTLPGSGDLKVMASQAAINSMAATSYGQLKANLGINRDFRLMLEVEGGSTTNYGSVPPNSSNVFSGERWFKVEETNGKVAITTLVW